MDDLLKHAEEMENERGERRQKMIAMYNTENIAEKEALLEKDWQRKVNAQI